MVRRGPHENPRNVAPLPWSGKAFPWDESPQQGLAPDPSRDNPGIRQLREEERLGDDPKASP